MPNEKELASMKSGVNHLLYRVMPFIALEALNKYFRLEVEGVENLPRQGAALVTPNHSGFLGLDACLLSHEINKAAGRVPRVLTHRFWFSSPVTSIPAKKFGLVRASMGAGLDNLKKGHLVVLFPEGEAGNFKPTRKRYHLQEFRRGFVRMALKTQTPIIPTLILGAEESNINLGQLRLQRYFPGTVLPLPLNLIPLPTKWRIVFLPPLHLPYKPEAAEDAELVKDLAQEIRESMQKALSQRAGQS